MKYKKGLIFICLIICLFSIASVVATEVNETVVATEDQSGEVIAVGDTNEIVTYNNQVNEGNISADNNVKERGSTEENELSATPRTFTDLANDIENAGGQLNLRNNYVYLSSDSSYKDGINIRNEIIIDGKGYSIDGKQEAHAFTIHASNVTLKNIIFVNTKHWRGGAIYCDNYNNEVFNINIINCTFINNKASYGGAIYIYSSSCIIHNCNFEGNQMDGDTGGAISFYNSNITISKCNFTNNSDTGAISFSNNYGGAISSDSYNYLDNVSILSCNFKNNKLAYKSCKGGAIYLSDIYSLLIENCTFFNSYSDNDGGAIYLGHVKNSNKIINCNFTNNFANSGGAISDASSNSNISNCIFINNSAKDGGAIYNAIVSYNNMLNPFNFVFNCSFINNSATNYGSAICTGYGSAICTFLNCSFINNLVTDSCNVIRWHCSQGNLSNCEFLNNLSSNQKFISLYNYFVNIDNCSFNGDFYNYYKYIDGVINLKIECSFSDIFVGETFNSTLNILPTVCGNLTIICSNISSTILEKTINLPSNNENFKLYLSNLTYGEYHILIMYSGDGLYKSKNNEYLFNVKRHIPSVNFTINNIIGGDKIIFTPTINSNATGYFQLLFDNMDIGTLKIGETFNKIILNGGKHNFTLMYSGDNYYTPLNVTKEFEVFKLNSTHVIDGYIEVDNSATVHAILNEDATGKVNIYIKGTKYSSNLIGGVATFRVPSLAAGTYTVTIDYEGDSKYNSIYTTKTLEVTLKPSTITLNVKNILTGNNLVITPIVTSSASGILKIYVDNVLKKTISIGSSYTIENPTIGPHSVRVVYAGDSYHQGNETKTTFRVFTFYPIEVQNSAIIYGMDKHFQAIVYDEYGNLAANKPVAFSINSEDTVVMSDSNGLAVFNKDLPIGTYYVSVINVYVNEEHTYILKVFTSIESVNMTRAYNTGMDFKVKLLDENADTLSRGYAIFNINNKDYPVVADNDGVAVLNANLPVGTYTVTTTNGRTGETKTNKITIVPSVEATNMVRGYNSGVDFKAKFLDADAKPLVNQKVAFKIGFTEYEATTDANGFAVLNEQLDVGKYEVTAINKVTGERATRNLTIVERIVENNNVIRIYGEESYYTIHIVGDDGSFVGENEIVNININNIDYQIRTNNNGYASFRIDENIGSYDILAEYKGYEVYNEVYVLERVNYIKNLNVTNINYKQIEVVSLNLSSFDNFAYVEFEVVGDNGYNRIFDQSAGNSITLPITNLNAGKYTVTAKYHDLNTHKFSSMAKTFIINKIDPKIIIVVEDANVDETATITVNIPDVEGNVEIKVGTALTFNEYLVKNGVIIKEIDSLPAGTYNVDVTYVGDNNYNRFTQSTNLTITQPKTLTKISASDITITQGKGTTLVATLKDIYGKALVGKGVSIYFNGVNSILTTNNNGEVKLAIKDNLLPKDYAVTITFVGDEYYVGSTASVKVTVNKIPVPPTPKTTITLKTVKVKKSAKKLVLQATLKQGKKPLKNKKITFKFNGKKYTAKTNKKGIAKVTIKKNVLKKLKVGKKVKYQASYGKKAIAKKTAKVKK